jgi:hypothetical protein
MPTTFVRILADAVGVAISAATTTVAATERMIEV